MSALCALGRFTVASARRATTLPRPSAAPVLVARRFLAAEAEKAAPSPPPPPAKRGGSSFLQRLGAFLTGAGLGCGIGYYHLANEIEGSTKALEKAIAKNHRDLSDRLAKLEKR